jgi:serine protease SohB
MMDVLWETVGFAVKGLVVFVTVAASAAVIALWARPSRGDRRDGHLQVKKLNLRMRQLALALQGAVLPPREHKQLRKQKEAPEGGKPRIFVLDFRGDVMASAVESLREEVNALCMVGQTGDEVVLRLESSGGAAHSYGLAASQLTRLKALGLKLTVCIDRVAASGGYMMACVAHEILAAPFAIVGSIGVAAPVPNAHRLLEKHGIEYENVTAGQFKRTVSYLAKPSPEGRKKFQEQIEETHQLFKRFVKDQRPKLDIDRVATGEHWHGLAAVDHGLVDRLMTSDDYLLGKLDAANVYQLAYERPRRVRDRFAAAVAAAVGSSLDAVGERGRALPLT